MIKFKSRHFNFYLIGLSFFVLSIFYFHASYYKVHEIKFHKIDLAKLEASLSKKQKCNCHKDEITLDFDLTNLSYKVTVKNKNLIRKTFNLEKDKLEYSNIACDPYKVLRRGLNQKVISYSVYGTNPFYFRYLKLITQTAKKLFPDWTIRFYHDNSFNNSTICELECQSDMDNVDFCNIEQLPFKNLKPNMLIPTFWRWLPIGDLFVDIFLSRDSDFCVVERDQAAVLDWLNSNTLFHVMRDHPYHDLFMLAGLWGFTTYKDRSLAQEIFELIADQEMSNWHKSHWNEKQADQNFLKKYLWDTVKKNVTIHDSFHCGELGGKPFPTQRPSYYCHVGGYGCCGPEYLNGSFPYECPYDCRPKEHKEWVFC